MKVIRNQIHCPPGEIKVIQDRIHCPPGEKKVIPDHFFPIRDHLNMICQVVKAGLGSLRRPIESKPEPGDRSSQFLGMRTSHVLELAREHVIDGGLILSRKVLQMIAVAIVPGRRMSSSRAIGAEAEAVLPEAIRLVELRALIPRYQRDPGGNR